MAVAAGQRIGLTDLRGPLRRTRPTANGPYNRYQAVYHATAEPVRRAAQTDGLLSDPGGVSVKHRFGTEDWSDYLPATTTGPYNRRYTHRLRGVVSDPGAVSVKHRFQYQVKAVNDIGEGAWSDRFPAAGAIPRPGHDAALDSLAVDDENVTVRWECPNYGWCAPLDGASVALLRLQARKQSGSGAWTG